MINDNLHNYDVDRYQDGAMRTAPHVDTTLKDWMNVVALGIAGESGELYELLLGVKTITPENIENIIKESGDVYWYIAVGLKRLGFLMSDAFYQDYEITQVPRALLDSDTFDRASSYGNALLIHAAQFAELVKKLNYHSHELDAQKFFLKLQFMLVVLKEIHLTFGVSSEKVMDNNLAKLQKRYPDKFTTALSIAKLDEVKCDRCNDTGRVWDNGDKTDCGCK